MERLEALREKCNMCHKCPLGDTRKNLVFGTGDPRARIMFVGEAPGEREDETGVPFVGAAGQLFDRYLFALDMKREDVYICNILKCRPPKNRDPLPIEEDACIEYLREQIEIVDPEIIVCLGRVSAKRLINEGFLITRDHGKFYEMHGRTYCAVYHPSALLRDPSKKWDFFDDLKRIKEKM